MTLRITFFCVFFPEFQFAGNSSTGIAILLNGSSAVESLHVIAQDNAVLPPGLLAGKTKISRAWKLDDPLSLVKVTMRLLALRRTTDAYFMNTYVTGFGRSKVCNTIGLLIPAIVSVVTRKRVVVYVHNLVETQDLANLGYRPSILSIAVAQFLERMLVKNTSVVMPLESQCRTISELFGHRVDWVPLPFIETLVRGEPRIRSPGVFEDHGSAESIRVLLFGTWGPQKDLAGALQSLSILKAEGLPLCVVIAGETNRHFPGSEEELRELRDRYTRDGFRFLGRLREDEVEPVISACDVVLLPYNTSGGYSATLNWAAFVGRPVIAYDVPQLREHAALVNADAQFIKRRDTPELGKAIIRVGRGTRAGEITRLTVERDRNESYRSIVAKLTNILEGV